MCQNTSMELLSPDHFLSLLRPDVDVELTTGVPDTSTLAAHDFDVDIRTGFMPPHPPLGRLPIQWEPWEVILDRAAQTKLQLGEKAIHSREDAARSEIWRSQVQNLPILPINALKLSEVSLRRAHHILAWIVHLYVHSLPPNADIRIPPSVAIPLLQICDQLQLPPVLTYSDTVLYNWALKSEGPGADPSPSAENIRCRTLFTGTSDEEEFFLCSARIELRGVEVLNLMRTALDEMFVGDKIAIQRITSCLLRMSVIIRNLAHILLSIRNGCNPDTFYHDIRPWLCGADADPGSRKWIFEGIDGVSGIEPPKELSGSSAAQCALFHALDIFLGISQYSHRSDLTGHANSTSLPGPPATFQPDFVHHKIAYLRRMQTYMPRHHRSFLQHLSTQPYSLRSCVQSSNDPDLLNAYNSSVNAVKEFRNAHLLIMAWYIIGPSKRQREAEGQKSAENDEALKGTGGSDMVQFLRGVRDQTALAVLPS